MPSRRKVMIALGWSISLPTYIVVWLEKHGHSDAATTLAIGLMGFSIILLLGIMVRLFQLMLSVERADDRVAPAAVAQSERPGPPGTALPTR